MKRVKGVAVATAAALLFGGWSISSATNAGTVESLVMVDAKGKVLGPIVEMAGPFFKLPLVPFKVGESIFVLSIFKNKIAGSGNPINLYFDNRRCDHKTGQAVAALDEIITKEAARDEAFWSFVGADGKTVYVPTPHAQPIKSFKVQSRLYVEPTGEVECQEYPKFIPTAIPATAIENLLETFTPPFSVDAVIKK
ncbi:MAG: hypothetical protein NNA18_01950 [Nitrospira sp.]|nr:hypothetical protein [Nitrospira sp.]